MTLNLKETAKTGTTTERTGPQQGLVLKDNRQPVNRANARQLRDYIRPQPTLDAPDTPAAL